MNKENVHALTSYNNQKPQIIENAPPKRSNGKRKAADVAPLSSQSTNGGVKRLKSEQLALPTPEDMPFLDDDGSKPPYSYAQLIGMAILRAPNRRLTLASIYNWISSSFAFYKTGDAGWQNSIRHNLSLNKNFYKQERPKDDPGKGNYWAIVAGMEPQFMKEKPRRNTLSSESNSFSYNNATDLPRPVTSSSNANFGESVAMKKIDSSKFPEEELSSDATIPASDPAMHEGIDPGMMPPPARIYMSSPPPVDIRSSPPPVHEREDTPPRVLQVQPSSRPSGGRKRKFGVSGLGDSGYYSSIESSVTRNGHVRFLASDVDAEHPALKRGRAEEEIRRMRSSSIDLSPLKGGASLQAPISFSSSPFKPFELPRSKNPLTPAVIFKKPARPPMSISPNTNLRNHREHVRKLLGSPDKGVSLLNSSPFKFPDLQLPNSQFELYADPELSPGHFDIFNDDHALRSSPLKSVKRPRFSRSMTSIDALQDAFGYTGGPMFTKEVAKPDFKTKLLGSPVRIKSPRKHDQAPSSMPHMALPQIPEEEDYMFGVNLPSDDSEPGLDISQGFQKIGAPPKAQPVKQATHMLAVPDASWMTAYGASSNGSPSKPPTGNRSARPPLGRSNSTKF